MFAEDDGAGSRVNVWCLKVGMVEKIKELCAELSAHFFSNTGVFEDGEVKVDKSGPKQGVSSVGADDRTGGSHSEGREARAVQVDHSGSPKIADVRVASRQAIRERPGVGAVLAECVIWQNDSEGRARAGGHNQPDLPSTRKVAHDRGVRSRSTKIIERVDGKILVDVKVATSVSFLPIKKNQRRNRSQERVAKLRARPIVKALAQREGGLALKAAESLDLYLGLKTVVLGTAVEKDGTDVANVSIQQRPAANRQWPGPYSVDEPHIGRSNLVAIVGGERLMYAVRNDIADHGGYFRGNFPFNVDVVV